MLENKSSIINGMNYYKHYSFDLWLTLIKSNPAFKDNRATYFHKNFNNTKKSLAEVIVIFRKVDLMCNSINEKSGRNIDSVEMYLMVISMINDYAVPIHDVDLDRLAVEMENLLFTYMPMIYSSETFYVLDYLKKRKENTISILSNTGFIPGNLLRKVLKHLQIDVYFDFQIYSDEVGMSKPNQKLFELMVNKLVDIRRDRKVDLNNIIHIGDNLNADINGANSIGISSILINSNNLSITSIIT